MFKYCIVLLYLLTTHLSYAQDTDIRKYWLGLGLGKNQFPSGMMALGYESLNKPTLLIARYSLNTEVFSDIQPGVRVSELGVLYGYKLGKFSVAVGLSGVWGVNRGKFLSYDPDPLIYGSNQYEAIRYKTIGVPAEIRFITSTNDVGIGVTAFGNLNEKRSFAGLNVSVYIGKMK